MSREFFSIARMWLINQPVPNIKAQFIKIKNYEKDTVFTFFAPSLKTSCIYFCKSGDQPLYMGSENDEIPPVGKKKLQTYSVFVLKLKKNESSNSA
jgi:hypothetical protein